jgi:hypothetical protein
MSWFRYHRNGHKECACRTLDTAGGLVGAVLFLSSHLSEMVGYVLLVDGGWTIN